MVGHTNKHATLCFTPLLGRPSSPGSYSSNNMRQTGQTASTTANLIGQPQAHVLFI